MAGLYAYRVTFIKEDPMEVHQRTGIVAGLSMASVFNTLYTWYGNLEYVEIEHITDGIHEVDEDTHSEIVNP